MLSPHLRGNRLQNNLAHSFMGYHYLHVSMLN